MEGDMYCTFCGAQNKETNKFCLECGKPLVKPDGSPVGGGSSSSPLNNTTVRSTQPVINLKISGKENMKRLATIGAVMVLICFFLPWLMVSCSLSPSDGIEMSGYDMVTMTSDANNLANSFSPYYYGQTSYGESAALFVILVLAIPICAGLSLFFVYKPSRAGVIVFTIFAILALLFFSLMVSDLKSSAIQDGVVLSFRIGFWGTWIGLGLLIYGGSQLPHVSRSSRSNEVTKY